MAGGADAQPREATGSHAACIAPAEPPTPSAGGNGHTHSPPSGRSVIHVGIHSSKSGCYKTLKHTLHTHTGTEPHGDTQRHRHATASNSGGKTPRSYPGAHRRSLPRASHRDLGSHRARGDSVTCDTVTQQTPHGQDAPGYPGYLLGATQPCLTVTPVVSCRCWVT